MSSFTFTEVVRLALVGVRGWGHNLLRTLSSLPSAELVVLCDASDTALASSGRLAPTARTTTRMETVLADSAVDAVVLAAGDASLAAECLDAGKHVFVEPPLVDRSDDARHLIDLASSKDLRLMTGHVLRYHPAIRHLQAHIADGSLGAIRTLDWRLAGLRPSASQSVLRQLGPSALSVTRALLDAPLRAVTAHGQRYSADGSEDLVWLTMEFGNGALAHLHLSRIDALKARRLTVVGSKGQARFDDMDPTAPLRLIAQDEASSDSILADYAHAVRARRGDVLLPRLDPTEPLLLECREFITAVREQRAPLTDGTDELATLRMMEAAEQSLATDAVRIELA